MLELTMIDQYVLILELVLHCGEIISGRVTKVRVVWAL